ncbi:MAG: AAA family ATPase [Arenicella sp.]
MSDQQTAGTTRLTQLAQTLQNLETQINQKIIGQPEVVRQVLIALLANGHVLLEGVPGLGKTLLVKTIASCFSGDFKRIQFTPDLMPADITGHVVYDMKESAFRMHKGPIFTNLLLADEINRAPAKSQAALLEVMQEKQVTIEGKPRSVPLPFLVLATQNPLEQEGTYPLPEAELDRFLIKIHIDYPQFDDELQLTKMVTTGFVDDNAVFDGQASIVDAQFIIDAQQQASDIAVDDSVSAYAVNLVHATRNHVSISRGAGTRACIALLRVARVNALLSGREFVIPDDVKSMAHAVIRHRVALTPEVEIEGRTVDDVLTQVFDSVDAPRI